MRSFRYERPDDPAVAVDLVAGHPAASYLGGGTNLVDLMRLDVARPDTIVDVARLGGNGVEALPDGGVRIAPAMRNSELAADPTIRRRYPVLSQALLAGASGQLRNLATTAGNLLQRTRCAYFQDVTTPCNKREPGSGCSALEGWTRHHAILGASEHCVATHPSDMAVAMSALGAVVQVQAPGGRRSIPVVELHRLPGDEPQRDTTLEHGDLITAVDLPALPVAARSHYRKARDRASYAFALVSVAAVLEVADGIVSEVRLALGGVAHKPWRATVAENLLRGAPANADTFSAAAEAELAEAKPLGQNAFKVALARNVMVSTLLRLSATSLP